VLGHFQSGLHYLRAGNDRLARRSLLNALSIMRDRAAEDPIEGVEGMTVGRLRETIGGVIPGVGPREDRQ
jgi:hypothetical protein